MMSLEDSRSLAQLVINGDPADPAAWNAAQTLARSVLGNCDFTPDGVALSRLTVREREVFQLIAKGLLCKQIAAQMRIGMKTVEHYRMTIKKKLRLRSAADLVRAATAHAISVGQMVG
jgi:DNA-binding NarL/FixJ family response regulator